MSLDLAVAQAVTRARILERALHDRGPWRIVVEWGDEVFALEAERVIGEDEIVFVAVFPELSHRAVDSQSNSALSLHCRDELVTSRPFELPKGSFNVIWRVGVDAAPVSS